MLKPEDLKSHLRVCGYRRDLLKANFPLGGGSPVALVAFAQVPTDARSACVAVLPQTSEPRKAVEQTRPLGAPLVFVCYGETLQWWKQGATTAEWLDSVPVQQVGQFFRTHHEEFSPTAVYRAKTWGRFKSEYQLTFVDRGLMPLVEEEVGEALSRLIERNVTDLKSRLGWDDISSSQGHWLLKSVFWLISGKILRDKQVPTFEDLDLSDVNDVFYRVARHYGTDSFVAGSKQKLVALEETARTISQFSDLALTTTESLAYIYENTLISKKTRTDLGTHSTPSFLVDYVVGNLTEWIQDIPERERSVFEPACGHAAFLVSAMRLLAELLPPEKAIPSRRGPYLRSRLHGTEIDSFALELARLSLSLTDIPNPDGWDLKVQDMFVGDTLSEQAKHNTIFLANPPFANFKPNERDEYKANDINLRFNNPAAEMLWQILFNLRPGSVFGVVLPQTFLHSSNTKEVRQFLIEHCELKEISLFPDKVFKFSDAESAIILGRRLQSNSRRDTYTQYRHIREPKIDDFRETFEASRTEMVSQSRFAESKNWDLRIPDLLDVWVNLDHATVLSEVAHLGQGLFYRGEEGLPDGAITYSEEQFPGAVRGFVRFGHGIQLDDLPRFYWMNIDDDVIDRAVTGTATGVPQVLLNYARVSRGPWRLKALIDRTGYCVTSRFISIRPNNSKYSLEFIWGVLNSPVANAYAFTHLGQRDNTVGQIRQIPLPCNNSVVGIEKAVRAYLDAAHKNENPSVLQRLLLHVDLEVLKLYDLPVELEWDLLRLFNGHERLGVPFKQIGYFPEEMDHPMRLADFLEFESDWSSTNRERGRLIDKDIAGTISVEEKTRLDALQAYADYYLDRVAPRPMSVLDELEQRLLNASTNTDKEG